MDEDLPKVKSAGEIKAIIEKGEVQDLTELFSRVSKKTIASGLGHNTTRFSNTKSNHPETFQLHELIKLAEWLDTDVKLVIDIFLNSIYKKRKILQSSSEKTVNGLPGHF